MTGAQTTRPGADTTTDTAALQARSEAARRARADTVLARVRPRIAEELRTARGSGKPVLAYIVDSSSGSSVAFDDFVRLDEVGKPIRDNVVLVRLALKEAASIYYYNSRIDSTATDSTIRALVPQWISLVDSTGHLIETCGSLDLFTNLWWLSHRLQQVAPGIPEATRERMVEYLMLWAGGW